MSKIAPHTNFYASKISKFLFVGIIILISTIGLGLILITRAKSEPQKIMASTFGPNTFTVSFFTDARTPAELIVADNKDFKDAVKFNDARDISESGEPLTPSSRNSHILVARGLEPEKQYWYKVATIFNEVEDSEQFTVTTPSVSEEVPSPQPVYGQVVDKNGDPLSNILIQAKAIQADDAESSVITTYTTENGSYSLDLANLRNALLTDYWTPKKDVPVKVRVTAMSNNQSFFYDTYDISQLTPVQTFMFDGVDIGYASNDTDTLSRDNESLARKLVGKAQAARCNKFDGYVAECCVRKNKEDNDPSNDKSGDCGLNKKYNPGDLWGACSKEGEAKCDSNGSSTKKGPLNYSCGANNDQNVAACCTKVNNDGNNGTCPGDKWGYCQDEVNKFRVANCGGAPAPAAAAQDSPEYWCGVLHKTYNDVMNTNGRDACKAGIAARNASQGKCPNYSNAPTEPAMNCDKPATPAPTQAPAQPAPTTAAPTKAPVQAPEPTKTALAVAPQVNVCKEKGYTIQEADAWVKNIEVNSGVREACRDNGARITKYCTGNNGKKQGEDCAKLVNQGFEYKFNGKTLIPGKAVPAVEAEKPVNGCFAYKEGNTYKCQQITFNKSNNKIVTAGVITANALCGASTVETAKTGEMLEGKSCQAIQALAVQPRTLAQVPTASKAPSPIPTATTAPAPSNTQNFVASTIQTSAGELQAGKTSCQKPLQGPYTVSGKKYCVREVTSGATNVNGFCSVKWDEPFLSLTDYKFYSNVSCGNSLTQQCMPASNASFVGNVGMCVQKKDLFVAVAPQGPTPAPSNSQSNNLCKNVGDLCSYQDNAGKTINGACNEALRCGNLLSTGKDCRVDNQCESKHCGPTTNSFTGSKICLSNDEYNAAVTKLNNETAYKERLKSCTKATNGQDMLTEENKPGYCDADDSANIRIVAYAQKGDRCETRQCAKDLACSSFGPATPKRCTTPDLKAQIDNAPKVNCYQAPENTICAQPGTGILGKCITSRNIRTCQVQNIEPAIVSPLTSYGGFNNSSMTIATGQTLDPGRYQLNSGTTLNLVSPATINFFADMNGNGVREENESLVTGQTFELQKQSESFSYELLNGWNALNFPFYQDSSTPYKASDLRAAAASQGMDIVSIKKWEGKWVEYTVSDGTVFGKDFILRPNEGYFVKTTVRGTVSLFGTTPKTSVPMQLNNGWSLVGVAPGYGENKSKNYNQAPFKNGVKAFEFLEVFNTADSSLQADNITRYDSGVYRGVSLGDSANGKKLQFGIDYEVDDLSAYFVKAKKKVTIAP